jgi:hypothetical protein
MAGDNGSRRFIRLWWVIAFTAGAAVGATSIVLIGLQDTIWWIVGVCGSVIAVTAIFERYGDSGFGLPRTSKRHWRPPQLGSQHGISRKETKPKSPVGRGRLRAINGKKIAEPPSGEDT